MISVVTSISHSSHSRRVATFVTTTNTLVARLSIGIVATSLVTLVTRLVRSTLITSQCFILMTRRATRVTRVATITLVTSLVIGVTGVMTIEVLY